MITANTPEAIWDKITKGVFIIAEAGKNFLQTEEDRPVAEYLENAKALVREAARAGADAVKFQTHSPEDEQLPITIVSPHFKGSDRYRWVQRNAAATPMEEFWKPLKRYCDEEGIIFFSTPMSRGAARIIDAIGGVNLWKIGSGDILDFVLLDYLRESGRPVIMSSGMSTQEEVKEGFEFLREKNDRIALLHCVSKYPCPPEDLHLRTIPFFKETFDVPVGFSDHSVGIESAVVAAAMGATIIEKHFSLSRDLWGSDHKVSMTPVELAEMSRRIREIECDPKKRAAVLETEYAKRGLGTEAKVLQEGEAVFRPLFRKSLMAGADMPAGTVLSRDKVFAMRPQQYAGGMPSERYNSVVGKKTKKAVKKYDPVTSDVLA